MNYRISISLGSVLISHLPSGEARLLPPDLAWDAATCLRAGMLIAAKQGRMVNPAAYDLPGDPLPPFEAAFLVVELTAAVLGIDVDTTASVTIRTDGDIPRRGGDGASLDVRGGKA